MDTQENQQDDSLLAGQEPHQQEELDQATEASAASFTLEPEKGISPKPRDQGEQSNIKQAEAADGDEAELSRGAGFDTVNEADLDAGEYDLIDDDLQALSGPDGNADEEESTL
ncbi:hypothetical protein ACSBL2_09025 [Pedobacter sp. AW31-3R]|uniref:hypothetical protein n=1 Tax=Pedobacter sp. AW31-3R TaxID=3445781 RepID=UPI003F9ECFCC